MKSGYQLAIKRQYIHIVCDHDFEITKDAVFKQWNQIVAVCKKTGIRKILIEACAPKRMISIADAQQAGSFFEKEGISALNMALCFTDYKTDRLSDFFETVGYNRGIQIMFFNNRKKGMEWLDIDEPDQTGT